MFFYFLITNNNFTVLYSNCDSEIKWDNTICVECEKEIIDTPTNHPMYKFYLEQLRKITKFNR
jgi:hydrogenase maturation factor HypF (carbamoyltransferase family)